MATSLAPIRVVSTLRSGSCPEGRIIQDRILKPLTTQQRKAGVKDELKEWYQKFGSVRPGRRDRRRQPDKARSPRPQPIQNDPPKDVQTEVYCEMRGHFNFVARDLARSGFISQSDIPDVEHDLFRAAINDLPKWDPEKSSRRTYLYEATALNKIDIVRALNAKKRQGDYTRLSITNEPSQGTESCDSGPAAGCGTVSVESIPERSSSVKVLEFKMDFDVFVEMLEADELLALDYLLADIPQMKVAELMQINRSTWRRTILESLQMKAAYCGFTPRTQKGVFAR